MWRRHHGRMPVGGHRRRVEHRARARRPRRPHGRIASARCSRLGAAIERDGRDPRARSSHAAAEWSRAFADGRARATASTSLEILVTSPGRQAANGDELVERLAARRAAPRAGSSRRARGGPARVRGRARRCAGSAATARRRRRRRRRRLGAGRRRHARDGASVGAVDRPRLAAADEPAALRRPARRDAAIEAARAEVERYLDGFDAAGAAHGVAVGGSARALKRIAGGAGSAREELDEVLALLATTPTAFVARRFGDRRRTARARCLRER